MCAVVSEAIGNYHQLDLSQRLRPRLVAAGTNGDAVITTAEAYNAVVYTIRLQNRLLPSLQDITVPTKYRYVCNKVQASHSRRQYF